MERLLQRLIFEQAATNPYSVLRKQREITIAEWRIALLHGWIKLSQQQRICSI